MALPGYADDLEEQHDREHELTDDNGIAIGRPLNADPALAERVRQMRADGVGLLKIGRTLGIGTGLVQRLALLKSSASALV
jgi:hypothetical protein